MASRSIDTSSLRQDEDWVGNNAAFTCPSCAKVFIVSQMLHREGRDCPMCQGSRGHVKGGAKSGGKAWLVVDGKANSFLG